MSDFGESCRSDTVISSDTMEVALLDVAKRLALHVEYDGTLFQVLEPETGPRINAIIPKKRRYSWKMTINASAAKNVT
jgi:hypothetical protein